MTKNSKQGKLVPKTASASKHKSKRFKEINILVTQFTSYFHDRPKHFTDPKCEEHFYPTKSRPTTKVNSYKALLFFDFGGLMSICMFMISLSLFAIFFEIVFSKWHHRKMTANAQQLK